MFPQTASSGAETSTAVRLIKPWQELLLDYFSILGIATGTFGIYAISLNTTAESVQCVPGEILQNISYYTSLKDYVNGKCSQSDQMKKTIGYPFFLFLLWFVIGTLQLLHKIPQVRGKLEAFYEYAVKEICGEMKPCVSSDKSHVRCKVVFAGPIYWIIERDIFDSWIRGETATFSCKISRQSFNVVTCENLLQAKIEGLFVANIMLILMFIINLSLLVTTMFRLWLETSCFPLNVFASFTSKSGSSRYSLLEFAFVVELLKQQHPHMYHRVFETAKVFLPCKIFFKDSLNGDATNNVAETFFNNIILNHVASGTVRLVNYTETSSAQSIEGGYTTFKNYELLHQQEVRKMLQKYEIDFDDNTEKSLDQCLAECVEMAPRCGAPPLGTGSSEMTTLNNAATMYNLVIVLAQVYAPLGFNGTLSLELQFVLPSTITVGETKTCLLSCVGKGLYKTIRAVEVNEQGKVLPPVPDLESPDHSPVELDVLKEILKPYKLTATKPRMDEVE